MKTKVRMLHDDSRYNEWKSGEEGYIDGYVRGGDDVPYAVVVLAGRIVFCTFPDIIPIGFI